MNFHEAKLLMMQGKICGYTCEDLQKTVMKYRINGSFLEYQWISKGEVVWEYCLFDIDLLNKEWVLLS